MDTNKSKKATPAKAGVGYTIGNIFIKGLSFLTLPIFTQLMSTADYGLYTTYVSYESILVIIVGLALHATLKNAKIVYKEKIDSYVSSMLLLTMFFTFILIGVSVIFRNEISGLFGFRGEMVVLMTIQAWGSSVLTMYNCRKSLDYAYKAYVKISFINSIGNVFISLLLIMTVCKSEKFVGRILGTSIPVIVLACCLVICFFKKARPQINKEYYKFGLIYSLPLIPHGISQLILSQFGKIIIQKKIGNAAAGIYGFAYTVALIPQIIVTSLDTVYGPWFFNRYENNEIEDISKRTSQYVALFSVIICGIFCISPEIIKIMSNSTYWESIYIVFPAILGVYFTFMYTIPAQIEYYMKKTKYIAIGTLFAAIINVIANIILVPRFGYQAAVYVTVVTYILYFVFHMLIAYYITSKKLPFNLKSICRYVVSVCFMCVIMQTCADKWFLRYPVCLIFCIYIAICNWEEIKPYCEKIRKITRK